MRRSEVITRLKEAEDARPEVPWSKIHGLGNLSRHEYRHVDPELLWSIATGQLDDLDSSTMLLGAFREPH